MKKTAILPVVLLLLLLLSSSGLFLTFIIKQAVIRSEIKDRIKSGLPKSELTLIKRYDDRGITHTLLKWFRENEFSYKGKMYDVVTRKQHGDTTWYYCIIDEKESSLFAQMKELALKEIKNNKDFKGLCARINTLLTQNFIAFINESHIHVSFGKKLKHKAYFFSVKTFIHSPATPPPEILYS